MHDPKIIYLQHRKKILIGLSIVVLLLMITFIGNATSFILYNNNLENKINDIETKVNSVSGERDACVQNLDYSKKELEKCVYNVTVVRTQISTCSVEKEILTVEKTKIIDQLKSCEQEKAEVSVKYDNQLNNFDTFIKSSVKSICCSVGDIRDSTVRNWSVSNNNIICSGAFSVNCTTGQTYP